jgi:hypothetical protein
LPPPRAADRNSLLVVLAGEAKPGRHLPIPVRAAVVLETINLMLQAIDLDAVPFAWRLLQVTAQRTGHREPDMTGLIVLGSIVGVFAVGSSCYLFVKWKKAQQTAKGEEVYHFRCPGCNRRLRFRARQVGNKGKCSHCGGVVVFPPISQAID